MRRILCLALLLFATGCDDAEYDSTESGQRRMTHGFAIGDRVKHKQSGLEGTVIRTYSNVLYVRFVKPATQLRPVELEEESIFNYELERIP